MLVLHLPVTQHLYFADAGNLEHLVVSGSRITGPDVHVFLRKGIGFNHVVLGLV